MNIGAIMINIRMIRVKNNMTKSTAAMRRRAASKKDQPKLREPMNLRKNQIKSNLKNNEGKPNAAFPRIVYISQ